MAIYWREWRALPLSLTIAMLGAHAGLRVAVASKSVTEGSGLDILGRVLLWLSVPAAFGALIGLWRIFENQARFLKGQRELLEHEARYRHLIENATDAFYAADESGRLILVNAAAARLFGRREGDLARISLFELVDEPTGENIRKAIETMRTKDIKSFYHEFSIHRRDGTQCWVGQNLQLLLEGRQVRGFQAVLRDVSDRRDAQDALRANEARLRTLFETMSEGVLQTRADGWIVFSNPAAERILGIPRKEIEARHCADPAWEFLLANGTPMPAEEWVGARALREKKSVPHVVTGLRAGRGAVRWLSAGAEPILGKDGQLEGVVIAFADISASKAAEENLRIIEFALDSAMEHVFLATPAGRLVYANKSALSALNYTSDEILSKTIFDITPDVKPEDWAETWRRSKKGEWPTFESQYLSREERKYPALTSVSHMEFNGREYLFAFAHDITREADLATQLRHAQKMEAIGMLAGGIAHDFNNILSIVLGYSELALEDVPGQSPVRPFLQQIQTAGRRATDLVKQILTFSRQGDQKRQPLRLAPVVKEALKLLRGTLPTSVEFRVDVDANCGPVMADPGQIHQVMMNLCTNAYHAMRPKGGVLTVSLREIDAGAEWTSAELSIEPGRYVELSIADTGCGMDEATQRRIFEPFFTTKQPGEGTGLGLATVHGIVKSHKGGIRVDSKPGKGTRFDVLFPLCPVPDEPVAPPPDVRTLARATETVLFVDDEAPLLDSFGTALRRLGYTVDVAANGREALARFESAPDRYDLVITDQSMPQMTGIELARQIRRLRPKARIVLCTGFIEAANRDEVFAVGIKALVAKPFELHELVQTLRGILDQPPPSAQ
jgi:PAS domain S-box-containing protein